jgi:predicted permease
MLVALQLALCVVLLAGAGLLVRTFWNLKALDVGFDRTDVLMFAVDVEATPLPAERLPRLCDELLERLRGRPGTSAVSCSVSVPVRGGGSTRALTVPGLPPSEDRDAFANQVTPGYFRTFGLALLRGRLLSDTDTATSQQVAVISERLARDYFGGEDPIGRTLRFGVREPRDPMTIVGVVGDTFQFNSLRDAPPRIVYTPIEQEYDLPPRVTVAVRSTEPPSALAAAARTEVGAVSRDAVVDYVRTMEQQIDAGLIRERVLATLSLWFGALALVLACVGLYGVMSYEIGRRRRDIGIRLALGAQPRTILRQVLLRTGAVTGAGIAGGLAAALAATRLLGSFLYGLGPGDPVTLGAGAGALAVTALVAGYLPARRASRVNPVVALRME